MKSHTLSRLEHTPTKARDSRGIRVSSNGGLELNTRHLEEYLVFSETLNWTVAAERLFTTRPTLVNHIRALEVELECQLVVSNQGKLALTPAGRRFTRTAKELSEQWAGACEEYRTMADNLLTVRVASSNLPWLETILYKARRSIQERHPYKRIEIAPVPGTMASVESLEAGTCDIAVAGFKSYLKESQHPMPEGVCGFALDTERIRLLMTQENPLFDQAEIRAADLDGAMFVLPPDIYRSWMRDGVEGKFAERGAHVTLRTLDFSGHTEYFTYEFGQMFGIVPTTLVPRYGIDAREEYRTFDCVDLPLETRFYAVCPSEFAASENGGLLFSEMRKIAAERKGAAA